MPSLVTWRVRSAVAVGRPGRRERGIRMVRGLETQPRFGSVAARGHRAFRGLMVLTLVSMLAAMTAVGVRPDETGAQDGALQTATVAPETALLYAAVNLDTASDQATLSAELL